MLDAEIRTALVAGRRSHEDVEVCEGPCIYAVFLQPRGLLLPIAPGEDGLLYVASAANGVEVRDHFVQSSRASDLRRTLGAILRRHLGLFPGPCAPSSAAPHDNNFMFAYDGEIILSRWMRANLFASVLTADAAALPQLEASLVADLRPPLILSGWDNPQRPLIEKFRTDALRIAREAARAAA